MEKADVIALIPRCLSGESESREASDPSVARPESLTDSPHCLITAGSPGTATITGTIYFYMTQSGYTLSDTFSFDVTVEPDTV